MAVQIMNLGLVILGILIMTSVGFALIRLFRMLENISDYEVLPYAFGVGASLLSFQLYLYSRLQVPWLIGFLMAPWLLVIFCALLLKRPVFEFRIPKKRMGFIEKTLLILIVFSAFFVVLEGIMRPVTSWDGWSSWLLRAKMYFVEKGVKPEIFTYIPSEYPVIVPLMSTYLYLFMGKVDDKSVLLLYPVFYVALGFMFYFSLRKIISSKGALFFTFLLLSIQNIIRHSGRYEAGQADIILGFYSFASMMLFMMYEKTRNFGNLLLMQIFLSSTALIKNEGISISAFIETILVAQMIRRKSYKHIFTTLIWLTPLVDWQFFKFGLRLPSVPSYIDAGFHFDRFLLISLEFIKEFINIGNWNLLWVTFFASLLCVGMLYKKSARYIPLFSLIVFQLFVYAAVFFFTSPDPQYHIPNVINRTFLHIAPLAVFAVGANVVIIRNKLKNGKV